MSDAAPVTVSRHFLRRRARAKERALQIASGPGSKDYYRVVKARRGPFRWRVVRIVAE